MLIGEVREELRELGFSEFWMHRDRYLPGIVFNARARPSQVLVGASAARHCEISAEASDKDFDGDATPAKVRRLAAERLLRLVRALRRKKP